MYNIILIKIMLIPNFMYTFGCVELFIILNGVTYTFMASEIFYGTLSLESNRGSIFIIFCTHSQLESRHDLGSKFTQDHSYCSPPHILVAQYDEM